MTAFEATKNMLHAAASFAIIFSLGLGAGLVFGPGPLVYANADHANLTMQPARDEPAPPSYPCSGTSRELRCSFVGANATWVCTSRQEDRYPGPDARVESCQEVPSAADGGS